MHRLYAPFLILCTACNALPAGTTNASVAGPRPNAIDCCTPHGCDDDPSCCDANCCAAQPNTAATASSTAACCAPAGARCEPAPNSAR